MKDLKHWIYAITIDSVPIYIGWTKRSLELRLREHVDKAYGRYKTKEDELREALRGEDILKNRLIRTALDRGMAVEIKVIEEANQWEPLDEQFHIDEYSVEYDLVNGMNGSTWQPLVMVDGELYETSKQHLPTLRDDIKEWKRQNRGKKVVKDIGPIKRYTREERAHFEQLLFDNMI